MAEFASSLDPMVLRGLFLVPRLCPGLYNVPMTIYEHVMIGVNGSLAFGLNRRYGWQIVALSGIAAILPDLDGLTILLSLPGSAWQSNYQLFAQGHRVWTHNLLVAGLLAAVVSALFYCFDILTRIQRRLANYWAMFKIGDNLYHPGGNHSFGRMMIWMIVGVAAAYSHLLMDCLFSIGKELPVWGVPLFWPFSDKSYAYPMVPWGDVGATIILAASMFMMIRWPKRIQPIACGSLMLEVCYIIVRGSHVLQ
jgi:membrane-bound metal-dependent hydrolase YbcI (DUF457 family)